MRYPPSLAARAFGSVPALLQLLKSESNCMKVIVTGAAGFIGFHVSNRLLQDGHEVLGIDNLNDYYEVSLKEARLTELCKHSGYEFQQFGVEESDKLLRATQQFLPDRFIHLGAQAGVRYSVTNPEVYIKSNVDGFLAVLEACRKTKQSHLVYASSSSVYGLNSKTPFSVQDHADHPASLYAATKRANELMAHCYSHLYSIPTTGLRFFTVYGPYGRPDMAPALFTKAVFKGEAIRVFNNGQMRRDFTFVTDIVESVVRVMDRIPGGEATGEDGNFMPGMSSAPYRVYNVGNGSPVELMDFIAAIEKATGIKANLKMEEMQPGDVVQTFADTRDLQRDIDFAPSTDIQHGVNKYVEWYRSYYEIG